MSSTCSLAAYFVDCRKRKFTLLVLFGYRTKWIFLSSLMLTAIGLPGRQVIDFNHKKSQYVAQIIHWPDNRTPLIKASCRVLTSSCMYSTSSLLIALTRAWSSPCGIIQYSMVFTSTICYFFQYFSFFHFLQYCF